VGRVNSPIRSIYLHDGTAIDIHRKHDQLKPSLYFDIDTLGRHADEGGGQVTEKLLEIHGFRSSSDFSGRHSCFQLGPALFSGSTSHSVRCEPAAYTRQNQNKYSSSVLIRQMDLRWKLRAHGRSH
jgi:hypothetical protein